MQTLQEAKDFLNENWKEGTICPCCQQTVKLYARGIHHSMAYCLIKLYKISTPTDPFHHVNEFGADGTRGGDFAKLRFWELVEEQPKEEGDTSTRTSGFWKITPKGRAFVQGKIPVQKKVLIYNNKAKGFDGEFISITQCLGNKFNYGELMGESDEA